MEGWADGQTEHSDFIEPSVGQGSNKIFSKILASKMFEIIALLLISLISNFVT